MNDQATTTAPATENTPVPAAPKAKKAKAAKKPAKATANKGKNGAAKAEAKTGLRKPQIRVLKALAKAGRALTTAEIAVKAEVDRASLSGLIGAVDPERRANDDKRYMSLLSLKYVRFAATDEDSRGRAYEITAAGKTAFEKADK